MRKLIEHFLLWTGALCLTIQSARAFSNGGPIGNADDAWQTITIGYGYLDAEAPKDIYEEYRPAVPVVYYASDESYLDYYGASGLTNIDAAFGILNGVMCGQTNTPVFLFSPTSGVTLPGNGSPGGTPLTISSANSLDSYNPSLSDFPLDSRQQNYTASALGLWDMKSYILHNAVLQLGLADPYLYVWTLHDRFLDPTLNNPQCPQDEEYYVVQRNFDVSPGVDNPYSSYINGDLFDYSIEENCGNGGVPYSAITFPEPDSLTGGETAVTAGALGTGGLGTGAFYVALTRDDVMGLRYLLSTNNINWESASAQSQLFTITTNYSSLNKLALSVSSSTNGAGFYIYSGATNSGFGYGDLAAFLGFITTNAPDAVLAAYPGVVITSTNFYPVEITNQTVSYSYSTRVGSSYGSLYLTATTNYTYDSQLRYNYTFANVFTNHIYTNTAYLVTTAVGPLIGSPYGSPSVTNMTQVATNYIGGDFFVMPLFYTNVCPVDINTVNIPNLVALTNLVSIVDTNLIVTNTTIGVSGTTYLVNYVTNYSYWINPVTCTATTGGTNSAALRRGLGRVLFIRANYDSLLGQLFQPLTNYYSMSAIQNDQWTTEHYARVVTAPDFLFQAADLTAAPPNDADASVTVPQFDTSAIKTALAGPGTIDDPGMVVVFNKTLNAQYTNSSLALLLGTTNGFLNQTTQSKAAAWGAFDGSTNYPTVYPSSANIASLMNQILVQVTPSSLADGTSGVPYNGGFPVTFTASGGQPPYTWAAPNFSTLVPGMTFSSSPPAIYGTPTATGVFSFTIQLTDSANMVVNLNYTITVH
jgi:hypothetical protein